MKRLSRILLSGLVVGLLAYSLLAGVTITRTETDFGLKFSTGGTVHASDNTTEYDFICDGSNDNVELQAALDALSSEGGTIELAEGGHYNCSAALTITKPIKWIGAGRGSTQIVQTTPNANLFEISNLEQVHFSDFSAGTVEGTGSIFVLTNVHRSTFEDIDSYGCGLYGFHLKGCLLDLFKNIVISKNIPHLFTTTGTWTAGFYGEAYGGIYINANTWLGCTVEGGSYGWYFAAQDNQGGNLISGGCAEGCGSYGVYVNGAMGFQIQGFWTETSGSKIKFEACSDSSVSVATFCEGVELVGCRNCTVSGRVLNLSIDSTSEFCEARNIGFGGGVENYSDTSDIYRSRTDGTADLRGFGLFSTRFPFTSNGNLEDWSGGLPVGWNNWNGATINQTGVGQSDTTVFRGNYAGKISKTGSPNTYRGLSITVPTEYRGQWISVEVWMKGISGGSQVIKWMDGGLSATAMNPVFSTTWQKFQVSFLYESSYTSMDLIFIPNYTDADASFYIDSIALWADYDGG